MDERPGTGEQGQLTIPARRVERISPSPLTDPAKIAYLAICGIPSSEAADLLEINQPWLAELVRRGELSALETPLGRLYDRDEVLQLREARRIAQAGGRRRGRPRKPRPNRTGEVTAAPEALPV